MPALAPAPPGPATLRRRVAGALTPARVWPAAVLLLGIAVSIAAATAISRSVEAEHSGVFDQHVARVAEGVRHGLDAPLAGLRGLRGALASVPDARWSQLRAYLDGRDMDAEFPGVDGFAYAERAGPAGLDALLAAARVEAGGGVLDTLPEARAPAHDAADRADRADAITVKYVEPLARNLHRWGHDLRADPALREAVDEALRSGGATLSGPLAPDPSDGTATLRLGFVVPLYRHGTDPMTPAQRRQSLRGMLVAPLRLQAALAGATAGTEGLVDVELFDGTTASAAALLFDLDGHLGPRTPDSTATIGSGRYGDRRFVTQRTLSVGGRSLMLRVSTTPAFDAMHGRHAPAAVLGISLVLTALAAWSVWLLAAGRTRAMSLAQSMSATARETADSLARERLRLADILEGTNTGVGEWNVATGGMLLSERWVGMLGYTQRELEPITQERWNAFVHPDDLPGVHEASRRHLRGETPFFEHELRVRHKSGAWRWVQIRSRVSQRDASGRAIWMSGAQIDIHERKLAEARWQARAEMSGDWFWQSDTEHRITSLVLSDRHREVTRNDALLGKRRDQIEWIDPPEGGWPAFHAMLDRREAFRGVHYRSHAIEGRELWIEIDGRPRFDAGGNFAGYEGVGRDATERLRTTAHLRESLAQLDALLEAIPVAVVLKDRDGVIRRANRAYCQLIGKGRDDLVGRTIFDLLEEPLAREHTAEDVALMAGGGSLRRELDVRLADGSVIEALLSKAPIVDAEGRRVGVVSVVVDIASQKATARAEADAREAAEAANRAKSSFLAAMSHEIRTPMNGVLGMAELLAQGRLDDDQSRMVGAMRHSAATLLRIIDDILDFSKIEAGRLELETAPLELTPLVEGVCDVLAPVAAAAGVALTVSVDPTLPERVLGDALRLRQVLNNLVGNAIKFSAASALATLGARREAAGRVSLAVLPGDGGAGAAAAGASAPSGVRICVADNGIGIDAGAQSRLFQPFAQAEASTTRRFGGTGLGLAICRRLVDLMGGRIEVASRAGEGATFTVHLPLAAAGVQPPREMPDLSGVHCVLVDRAGLPVAELQAWLAAAGATASITTDLRDAATRVVGSDGADAITIVDEREVASAAVPPSMREDGRAPQARQLRIGRGRRGPARIVAEGIVSLDLLRRAPFLRAVAMLAGRASPEPAPAPRHDSLAGPRVAPPGIEEARARGQLILVAEDDETNRTVIVRQLALLGYAAEVAADGSQALALWQEALASGRPSHALLLTDVHMPELDGYALAAAIRHAEIGAADPRQRRMPVLALTANALKGEAVRARAAGMDDYLTKPVSLAVLQAALEQWMPAPLRGHAPAAATRAPANAPLDERGDGPPDGAAVLDLSVLRRLVGHDSATLSELLAEYLRSAREQAAVIMQALETGDLREAGAVAHKLKSASRSVGALALGAICAEFERKRGPAQTSDLRRFAQGFAAVEDAITHALAALPAPAPPEEADTGS